MKCCCIVAVFHGVILNMNTLPLHSDRIYDPRVLGWQDTLEKLNK